MNRYLEVVQSRHPNGKPKSSTSIRMIDDHLSDQENLALIHKAIVDLQKMAAELDCGPFKMPIREYKETKGTLNSRIQPIKDLRSCAGISLRMAKELIVHIDERYGLATDPLPKAIYILNAIYAEGYEIEHINCNTPSFHKKVRSLL